MMLTVDRTWEAGRLTVDLVGSVHWRNLHVGVRVHDWWGNQIAVSLYLVFWCLTVGWARGNRRRGND